MLLGGMVAAPAAAVLARYLPARVLGVTAGGVIVLTNLTTLGEGLGASAVNLGLLAAVVFTLYVLWVSWAVKIEQHRVPPARRSSEWIDSSDTLGSDTLGPCGSQPSPTTPSVPSSRWQPERTAVP
jgi:hypothetical protein